MDSFSDKMKAIELVKKMYSYAGFSLTIKESQLNDRAVKVIQEMITAILKCAKAMSLVPQPPMGKPGVFWLASNARKIFSGIDNNEISKACIADTIRNYKSKLYLATI